MILVLGSLPFSSNMDDWAEPPIKEVVGMTLKPSVDLSPNAPKGFYSFRFFASLAFDEPLIFEGLLRLVGFSTDLERLITDNADR
jgi:hypothetical protein